MRNNYISWNSCLLGVAIGLLSVASCSEEPVQKEADPGLTIRFTSEGVKTTRAYDPADYEQFPDGAAMGVFAYNLSSGAFDPTTQLPDLLYNATLTKITTADNTSGYQSNPVTHWPSKTGKVLFAAYHPHSNSIAQGSISLSSPSLSGLPEITLELGLEKKKIDFAVSSVGPIAPVYNPDSPTDTIPRSDNYVNFRFKRKLSEVAFRAKAVNITPLTKLYINAISIKNIYKKGTYQMGNDQWVTDANTVDATSGATMRLATGGAPISESDFEYLLNPGSTSPRQSSVVMIPQEYNNVEMEVIYTLEYLKAEGGCEYRIVGNKKVPLTVKWQPGKFYVYDIEFGFFEAEGEAVPFRFNVSGWVYENISTEID